MRPSGERCGRGSDEHYTPIARAYTISPFHAQGFDLDRMVDVARVSKGARLLDIGTGTGHTALAFARRGVSTVGLDLTRAMLDEARGLARERGATFDAVQGAAERLPFADESFDAVACRYCAHHFIDIPAAIREMRRVLRRGGPLVFVDHVAPESNESDAFVNHLDWLRDPSHRREPRMSEYEIWFAEAGLAIDLVERWQATMIADDWFARARTTPSREAEARALLTTASPQLRETFSIVSEPLSFDLHMALIRAR